MRNDRGTATAVEHVANLEPRRLFSAGVVAGLSPLGAKPEQLAVSAGPLTYFSGRTAAAGRELWATDATAAGTRMVVDLAPGKADAAPTSLLAVGRLAYFAATVNGKAGLYRSDGTAAGTFRLLTLKGTGDFAAAVAAGGDAVSFQLPARDGSRALWRSDGSIKGTVAVVAAGLPAFRETVANPATGELLAISGKEEDVLTYSDGTAAGTRRLSVKGDTFGNLTSADGAMYVVALHHPTMTLHRVGGGKVASVVEERAVAVDGAPGGPAYALRFAGRESGTFARYDAGRATDYRFVDRATGAVAPMAFNEDALLAGDGAAVRYLEPNAVVGTHVWRADDKARLLRYVGRADLGAVEGAVPVGDATYAVGPGRNGGDRALVRLDAAGRQTRLFDSRGAKVDAADPDANGLRAADGGRLLFRGTSAAGAPELFALDPRTDRVEQLTDQRGPGGDVTIVAQAHAGGRSLILSWSQSGNLLSLDLVAADGTATLLYRTQVVATGSGKNVRPKLDHARALADDDTAYVSIRPTGVAPTLLRVDLAAGTCSTIKTASGAGGKLIAVDGRRAYFNVGTEVWTTTGKSSTTKRISGALNRDDPASVGATMLGGRAVFTDGASLYAADTAGVVRLAAGGPFAGLVAGDGVAFVAQGDTLLRTDGTVAGTTTALAPTTFGANFTRLRTPVASADGVWVYAVVSDVTTASASRPWRVVRLRADGTGGVETVLSGPSIGWLGTYYDPTLIAATADDLVLRAREASVYDDVYALFRASPAGGEITALTWERRGFDSDPGSSAAYAEGVLLTSSRNDQVLRLRGGVLRALPGLFNPLNQLSIADGSAFAPMTAAGTGRTLFRHRLDTVVSGVVFNDLDADRGKDANERGHADWRVWIDRDDDGRWDADEPYVRTDYLGRFEFFELDPGSHKLRVGTLADYESTTGYVYTIKLKAGERVTKRFGARPIR